MHSPGFFPHQKIYQFTQKLQSSSITAFHLNATKHRHRRFFPNMLNKCILWENAVKSATHIYLCINYTDLRKRISIAVTAEIRMYYNVIDSDQLYSSALQTG